MKAIGDLKGDLAEMHKEELVSIGGRGRRWEWGELIFFCLFACF